MFTACNSLEDVQCGGCNEDDKGRLESGGSYQEALEHGYGVGQQAEQWEVPVVYDGDREYEHFKQSEQELRGKKQHRYT